MSDNIAKMTVTFADLPGKIVNSLKASPTILNASDAKTVHFRILGLGLFRFPAADLADPNYENVRQLVAEFSTSIKRDFNRNEKGEIMSVQPVTRFSSKG